MIVSFGWTWPAVVAGHKFCTRRNWVDSYGLKFKKRSVHVGYDRDARWGGKPILEFKLTQDAYKESTLEMPDEDYEKEGFAFLNEHRRLIPPSSPFALVDDMRTEFQDWRERDEFLWVVRFKPVIIYPEAKKKLDDLMRKHGY